MTGKVIMFTLPAYVGIILQQNNQVLLVKRCNTDWAEGLWNFPGGSLEENESSYYNLIKVLQKYEIPIGVIPRIQKITEYEIFFIIDDSGSMSSLTDSKFKDINSDFLKTIHEKKSNSLMRRWDEVEDRINSLLEILINLNVSVTIKFMNRTNIVRPFYNNRRNLQDISKELHEIFLIDPSGHTPIFKELNNI